MAKEVAGFIKLQIKGGAANPSPPVQVINIPMRKYLQNVYLTQKREKNDFAIIMFHIFMKMKFVIY